MFRYKDFPILETERLILRQLTLDDSDDVYAIRKDFEVTKYNIGKAYTSITQAENLIKGIQEDYDNQRAVRWGITFKDKNTVMGVTGFNYWNHIDNRASIGFDLARHYWRKGIMREAVSRMIQFGFQQMKLHRIEADASIYNEASIGLLKSLGFQQEGLQKDQYYEDGAYHDLVMFALLEDNGFK